MFVVGPRRRRVHVLEYDPFTASGRSTKTYCSRAEPVRGWVTVTKPLPLCPQCAPRWLEGEWRVSKPQLRMLLTALGVAGILDEEERVSDFHYVKCDNYPCHATEVVNCHVNVGLPNKRWSEDDVGQQFCPECTEELAEQAALEGSRLINVSAYTPE